MSATFDHKTLGDLLEFFNGRAIKPGGQGAFPVYGSNGLIGRSNEYRYENAIIIGRVGAYCGSIEYCPGYFWASDNTIVVKEKADSLNIRFLYYLLQNLGLNKYAGGAAQPLLTQATLRQVPVRIPSPSVQDEIASILSAYDDLIENNTRRIAILEEMAHLLYREWFVHYRFPGHEGVPMVDSPLGLIPEGWAVKSFAAIAELSRVGIAPSRYPDEIFAHFSIPAYDEGHMPRREQGATILSNKLLVPEGCVLLSKINPRIPRVWLPYPGTEHRSITSTEFLVLIPKAPTTTVHLFDLCTSEGFLSAFAGRALGTSTSHQRVQPTDLLNTPVVVPSPVIVQHCDRLASPIALQMQKLREKSDILRRTRDLLLPRLVSGEVEVERMEIIRDGDVQ